MNKFRPIVALLLLLAYTGQSLLAVGAPCTMSVAPAHDMADMDHSGHHDMAPAAEGSSDCCDGGFCSMSHCESAAAMPQSVASERVNYPGRWCNAFLLSSTGYAGDSLFRPPISH